MSDRNVRPGGRSVRGAALMRAVVMTAVLTSTAACASVTPISRLLAEPQRYDGKEVTVRGEVQNATGFLGSGAFRIDDGSGSIFVISQGQGVPAEGSTTKVKGRFESLFNIAGRSVAAIVLGPERRPDVP